MKGEAARLVERFRTARRDPTLAVLEGFHALKHALRFGAEIEIACTPDPASLSDLATTLAPDLHLDPTPVDADTFAALSPSPPPTGVIAIAKRLAAPLPPTGHLVLLERPSDLGNLGAVIRVAAAAGAAGVLTMGGHDPWHPNVLRAAAGLHFALAVRRIETLPTGRPLIALDPGGDPLGAVPLPPNAILAFGTERDGLSDSLLQRADVRLAIPMRPGVSSLNLATAVAVVLYADRPGVA